MSSKAIGSALVVLILLAGLAFWLGRGGSAPATPHPPLLQFDPGAITAIEVQPGGKSWQRVERVGAGEWRYVTKLDAGKKISWPAAVPADAMRLIASLSGAAGDTAFVQPDSQRGRLRFWLRDGARIDITVTSALGGRSTLIIEGPEGSGGAVTVDSSAIEPLFSAGPSAWRIPVAAPQVRDASRVTILRGTDAIALARVDGRWTMRRPVAARADPDAVESLIGALSEARVERFEDGPIDAQTTGLHEPAMTIEWEIDERTPDATGAVRVETHRRQLRIGGPADPHGALRFASADDAGRQLMVVPASVLTSISTAPRNYLSPTVTGARPQDVFLLTISDSTRAPGATDGARAYRRDMGQWVSLAPDGTKSPADSEMVERLLEFLSARPGESEPARGEGEIREILRIDLFDLDGNPMDVITAGFDADGTLAFRSQNLVTSFPGVPPPDLLAMPEFATLPSEPAPPEPLTLPPGAPAGK